MHVCAVLIASLTGPCVLYNTQLLSLNQISTVSKVVNVSGKRTPAKPARRPEEEEADIEAQLEKERQEMLQKGRVAGGEALEGETYVLKVSCKHGSCKIRQQKDGNFVTLHDKFKKYAIEQQWATQSTKLRLTCDDEDVDLEQNTPDDFELEDGMTVDVVMK